MAASTLPISNEVIHQAHETMLQSVETLRLEGWPIEPVDEWRLMVAVESNLEKLLVAAAHELKHSASAPREAKEIFGELLSFYKERKSGKAYDLEPFKEMLEGYAHQALELYRMVSVLDRADHPSSHETPRSLTRPSM